MLDNIPQDATTTSMVYEPEDEVTLEISRTILLDPAFDPVTFNPVDPPAERSF